MADIKKFQFILDGKIANDFKSELNKLGGTINELNDTQVIVDFNENATMANFRKLYQKLEKENSDLTVQFRYDINKMMLEKAQKELSSLEVYADSDKANKEILELAKRLQDIKLKLDVEGISDDDVEKLETKAYRIVDKIGKILSTHISLDGSDKIFNNLPNEVKEIIETLTTLDEIKEIEPFDTKNIEKQLKEVKNIKRIMSDLEGKGAVSVTETGGVDESKVEELQKEIAEVKEDISSLKGRVDTLEDITAFDTLSSKASGFDKEVKGISQSVIDLQKVLIPLYDGINKVYKEKDGKQISGYWDTLKKQIDESDSELKELLKTIGLYDSESNSLNLIATGNQNSGGLIGDDKVLISRKKDLTSFEETLKLKERLDEAYKAGVNVSRILDVIGTKESDVFLEIQERNHSSILGNINNANKADDWINPELFEATDKQLKKLIEDAIKLDQLGFGLDIHESNVLFDKEKGFSIIDLDLNPAKYENYAEFIDEIIGGLVGAYEIYYEETEKLSAKEKMEGTNLVEQFRERFVQLANTMQQAYAEAQDSHSPSKEFEKLENDAVDGIVEGANKNEDRLKNVGKQMADNIKEGFKEGISEIGTTTLSPENQSTVLSVNQTEVLSGGEAEIKHQADIVVEAEKEKQKAIKDTTEKLQQQISSIKWYRGIDNGDDAAVYSSERYNGATFWTNERFLARQYGTKYDSFFGSRYNVDKETGLVAEAEINAKKTLLIDALDKEWNKIEFLGDGTDELSKKMLSLSSEMEEIEEKLKIVSGGQYDRKYTPLEWYYDKYNPDDNIDTIYPNEFKSSQKRIQSLPWNTNGEFFGRNSKEDFIQQSSYIFESLNQADQEIVKKLLDRYYNIVEQYWKISDDINNPYGYGWTGYFVEKAQNSGFDSILFKNIQDGLPEITDVFVSFIKEQIKSVKELNLTDFNITYAGYDKYKRDFSGLSDELSNGKRVTQLVSKYPEIRDMMYKENSNGDYFTSTSDEIAYFIQKLKDFIDQADLAKKEIDGLNVSVSKVNQTPLSLVEETSGQLAMFDGVEEQQKEVKTAIEKTNDAIEGQITLVDYLNDQKSKPAEPIKDTFDETPESSKMDKVTTATEEAVQAKKDFAIANEGVQDSVDGSKSKLELEAELMEKLAKSAREAADAKKEFVKANKEVKDSEGTSDVKKSNVDKTIDKINSYNKTDSFFGFVKNGNLDSKRYQNISKEIESIIKKQGKYASSVKATEEEIQKLDDATQKFADDFEEKFQNQQLALADNLENKIKRITSGKTFDEDNTKIISDIEKNIDKLRDINLFDANDLSTASQVSKLISDINAGINQIKNVSNNPIALLPEPEDINKSIGQINKVLSGGYKIPRKLRTEFEQLRISYKNAFDSNGNVKITNAELQKLENTLSKLNAEFEATGKHKSIMGSLTSRITDMNAKFLAQYFSFQDIVRYGQQGFETIKEYDKALTEMDKVSNESIHTLKEFQEESFGLADAVGTTASQIQNSTSDFLRLGESFEQAKQSAQDANALLKVSEFTDISEATDSLIAMSAAYDELEKSEINDILNYTGNNFSISTSELASALQRSAATLKVAGNDIYEATALVTAGNAVLQDAESVGTGKFMPEYIVICRFLYQKVAITVKSQRWSRPWEGYNIC